MLIKSERVHRVKLIICLLIPQTSSHLSYFLHGCIYYFYWLIVLKDLFCFFFFDILNFTEEYPSAISTLVLAVIITLK